jgi:hypothetical protein
MPATTSKSHIDVSLPFLLKIPHYSSLMLPFLLELSKEGPHGGLAFLQNVSARDKHHGVDILEYVPNGFLELSARFL